MAAFAFGLAPIADLDLDSDSSDSDYDDAETSSSSDSMHIGRTLHSQPDSDDESSDYLVRPSAEEKEIEEDKEASLLRGMDLSSVMGMMDAMKQRNTLHQDSTVSTQAALSDYEDIVRLMTGNNTLTTSTMHTTSSAPPTTSRRSMAVSPSRMARVPSVEDYLVSTFATVSTLSTTFSTSASGAGSGSSSSSSSATMSSAATSSSSSSSSLAPISPPLVSTRPSASALLSTVPPISAMMSSASIPRRPMDAVSVVSSDRRGAKSSSLWTMTAEELARRSDVLNRTQRRIAAEQEKVTWLRGRKHRQEDWGPSDLRMWLAVMNEESEYKGSIAESQMRKLCEFIESYQMTGKDFIYQMNDMIMRKIVGLHGTPADDQCRKMVITWVTELRTSEEEKVRKRLEEEKAKAAEEKAKREAEEARRKREEEEEKKRALKKWNELQAQSGCPICYGKDDSYLLSPCNHAGFCLSCASQFIDARCPFCKRYVDSVEKVFYVTQQLVKDDP